jgi:hypothetical protein
MLLVIHDKLAMKDASRYLLDGNTNRELRSGSWNFKTQSIEIFLVHFRQSRRQPVMFLHSPWYFHSPWYTLAFRHGVPNVSGDTMTRYDPFIFLAIMQEATCNILHLLGRF